MNLPEILALHREMTEEYACRHSARGALLAAFWTAVLLLVIYLLAVLTCGESWPDYQTFLSVSYRL